jgi:multiple sugar transport system permease protein
VRITNKVKLGKTASKRISGIIIFTILSIGALTTILPFFWMAATSLDIKANVQLPFPPRLFPKEISFMNYYVAFNNIPLARYLLNSFYVTLLTIIFRLTSSLLAGYALSKINFKGKKILLLLSLATLMVPFEMLVIPMWKVFRLVGLLDNYWAIILPAISWPWGVFLAKQYMDSIPTSLKESAKIDGANELQIFIDIYFPLSGPIVATLAIFAFLASWNSFLWPLIVISDDQKYLIQIGIAMLTSLHSRIYPSMTMALSVVSAIPVIIVFLFLQKYIVESISLTGLKQ